MATRKDSDDRMEIISLLDKSRSDDVLNAWVFYPFFEKKTRDLWKCNSMGSNVKIMTVLRSWIFTCMNTKDDECLLAILKYLSRLPITKESATASKIGKMVQKLTKEGAPAIKKLANEVKDNWFSKLDTPTPTAPTPVESSKSMPAKEDTRKRDRSTDSVQSSTSSMTGKPDIQVVSAKKARPSAATSSAKKGAVPIIPSPGPVEKKKAASVPSFDIFKSLSAKPDLPKIKKSDKPVERKPEKQEMRTTASEVVITSITPAEGAPAPLFSYRKEK